MNAFLQRHQSSVMGMLSGFDRLLFRGTLRFLATAKGLMGYLWSVKTLLKDFGDWSLQLTEQVKRDSLQVATDAGRPVVYVIDPSARKEELALEIARRDKIDRGLVCVLTAVEPCCSYDIHRNREKKKLELVARQRKCLHLYHYQVHPQFGLMHARLQTWLPFNVKVCLNGRQWLGRQMDRAGIDYVKRENCFTRVSDLPAAQALLDAQLTADWPGLLDAVRRSVHPAHDRAFAANPLDYYWSVDQSEWASDVLFKDRASLAGLYPRLINQGMATLGSRDVMRFLGRRVPVHGGINGNFDGQVITTLKERPEGIRLKHQVKHNSVKMYDKQGSVLRVETTLNDTRDFKVYRKVEGKPKSKAKYRQLRKGVADLHRRAELSQACNDRYLQAMAAVETTQTLGELTRPLCRATTWNGQRVRPLHPLGGADADLLQAISGGEFLVNGFRNRDLREQLLGGSKPSNDKEARRKQSGVVTRKLRLLRAHGLVRKVPRTHRYLLTETGRLVVTALQAAKAANPTELRKIAA
jgi:hypothetical protein